jgi:hypothetical protein
MSAFNGAEQAVPYQELAWTLIWSGDSQSLIPIIPTDRSTTDFMNRDASIVVVFDGWQVIRADGVLPDDLNVEIEKTDSGLDYSTQDQIFASHACEEFASSLQGTTTVWVQNCESPEGSYANEIRVNAGGSITLLQFLIHPEYPMVTLTPNNLIF